MPQLGPPWSAHSLFGSVPVAMSAHTPSGAFVRALRHDLHVPPHALLQQTPPTTPGSDTQLPLAHWFADVHASPSASFAVQLDVAVLQ